MGINRFNKKRGTKSRRTLAKLIIGKCRKAATAADQARYLRNSTDTNEGTTITIFPTLTWSPPQNIRGLSAETGISRNWKTNN